MDGTEREVSGEHGERDYRSVLDGAHEAFVAMDAGGFISDWNPQAEATFGWRRDEAIGRVLADTIIPERYRDAHWKGLQRFLETGEGTVVGKRIEIEALHREGFELPVELTISAHRLDDRLHFNAFLHDISDRRRAALYVDVQHAVTKTLAGAETEACVIVELLRQMGERMSWEFGAYWQPDVAAGSLVCNDVWSLEEERLVRFAEASRAISFAEGIGLPGRVWESRRPALIADVVADDNFPRAPSASEAGLHAALALPVLDGDEPLGVIEFFSGAIGHGDDRLLEALASIGKQVGHHLSALRERVALLARMEEMARTDELTGLPNRRAWDDALDRELARAKRTGERFSIAMLDLDRFKDFNDERGHQAGDDLLARAGVAWAAAIRAADFLARYGGEEFTALLSGCPPGCAVDAVERIRSATPAGQTCSAGIAAWDGTESAQELIARADAALYEAKRAGRDRIVVADG